MANTSKSMWNPENPIEISPEDYERQVLSWISELIGQVGSNEVSHLKTKKGDGGDYVLDGLVEFEILNGASLSILVECKRYKRPVERETVLAVHARLQDVGAHKAIIFSTAGFQKGAIEYATRKGIALVTFIDGKAHYFTRSAEKIRDDWYPADLPKYAGEFLTAVDDSVRISVIDNSRIGPLSAWILTPISTDLE